MSYDIPSRKGHSAYKDVSLLLRKFVQEEKINSRKLLVGFPLYTRGKSDLSKVKTYDEYLGLQKKQRKEYDGKVFSHTEIGKKVRFIKENNLGGLFFWEIGQDSFSKEKSLTKYIHNLF
eukprot:snap_masked-scaffold_4-processed-gene-7.50-mRNA-1 protein AED:1.00 eAED:1.00 QI:0/-1/0/0/-1/1/1/0/118